MSRAFPPTVGGIENQNYQLSRWMAASTDTRIIANGRGRRFLPLFLPWALFRTLVLLKDFDVLLLGDGVLAVVGWAMKLVYAKPVISVLHGLDVTYSNPVYQKFWVGTFMSRLDRFIAVSSETARQAMEKGIPGRKIVSIPNGITTGRPREKHTGAELEAILGMKLHNRKIMLSCGRLVKRKGVAWFCQNVMPELTPDILYVVAGDGPDRERIAGIVARKDLASRVVLLGQVTNEVRDILLNTCDLFLQPNIKVRGDVEGFGLAVLEAASCGMPVVASAIEGLRDAVKDGENGFLVESANPGAWTEKILELLGNEEQRISFGKKAREFVVHNYDWSDIAGRYLHEVNALVAG